MRAFTITYSSVLLILVILDRVQSSAGTRSISSALAGMPTTLTALRRTGQLLFVASVLGMLILFQSDWEGPSNILPTIGLVTAGALLLFTGGAARHDGRGA